MSSLPPLPDPTSSTLSHPYKSAFAARKKKISLEEEEGRENASLSLFFGVGSLGAVLLPFGSTNPGGVKKTRRNREEEIPLSLSHPPWTEWSLREYLRE